MNKFLKEVEISDELRDYIEALAYDVESRKNIIIFALEKDLIHTDSFKQYQKEYQDAFVSFELAKQELEKTYVKPIIGDRQVIWDLDYSTKIITIKEV